MPLPFKILPTDELFTDSPFEGDEDCLCSRCGSQIPEEACALRAWVDEGRGGEYRWCDYCQEQMGIWSHDHYPEESNACGECGNQIVKVDGKWKLAQPVD
jgi:hypothetical protein